MGSAHPVPARLQKQTPAKKIKRKKEEQFPVMRDTGGRISRRKKPMRFEKTPPYRNPPAAGIPNMKRLISK